MKRIDLNCDLGEGAGNDAELMPLCTSANIACGAHAGNDETMRATVALALRHGVGLGAHPGFADPAHFGRRELNLPVGEIEKLVAWQVLRLRGLGPVRHVKPHGGLYAKAARDRAVADAIARAVFAIDRSLILFAPSGSELAHAGVASGLRVAEEVFADRTYQPDGSLTPRSRPDALVRSEEEMAAQARRMILEGCVRTTEGGEIAIRAGTICLHGDGEHAVAFARRLRKDLAAAGIEVAQFS